MCHLLVPSSPARETSQWPVRVFWIRILSRRGTDGAEDPTRIKIKKNDKPREEHREDNEKLNGRTTATTKPVKDKWKARCSRTETKACHPSHSSWENAMKDGKYFSSHEQRASREQWIENRAVWSSIMHGCVVFSRPSLLHVVLSLYCLVLVLICCLLLLLHCVVALFLFHCLYFTLAVLSHAV